MPLRTAALRHQVEAEEPVISVALLGVAISANPDAASLHVDLGNALKGLGRFDTALAAYNKAISL